LKVKGFESGLIVRAVAIASGEMYPESGIFERTRLMRHGR